MAKSENDRENVLTRLKEKGESLKRWMFTKPEILQEAEQHLRENFWDPGDEVRGNQTWMETKPREAWESYEGITHPNLQRGLDMAKVVPNAAWNFAQFAGNMGWEGANALDRWVMGDPLIKKENKYKLDASLSNKFGWDPYYEDNPYAEKNKEDLEGIYDTAEKEKKDYWNDILKKNDEDKDMWHDGATKYAEEQLPWAKWQRANPGVSTNEYYKELTDIYNNRLGELYDDQYQSVHDNSIKSQMFSEYGFGEKDKSAFEDWNWWDHSRALDYSTPEAEESLGALEIVPEVFFPLGGLSKLKHLKSLRGVPKKEGIMGVKRIEDANKYKHAEEWLKQNAGWRGSGR
jgi:hypothetical protein